SRAQPSHRSGSPRQGQLGRPRPGRHAHRQQLPVHPMKREIGLLVALLLSACSPAAASSQPTATPVGTASALDATPTASPTAVPTAVAEVPTPPVQGRDAPLMGPVGLAFDKAGNLYVSECM